MDKDISTLLREIRAATSWSQIRIAGEIGSTQPTVNRILKGQKNCMGITFCSIQNLHERVCQAAPIQIKNRSQRSRKDK